MTNDDDITDILPLLHDGLDLKAVAQDQRREFPELWQLAKTDYDYDILNGVFLQSEIHQPTHAFISSFSPPYRTIEKLLFHAHIKNVAICPSGRLYVE